MLRLTITRQAITIEGPDRATATTRALVALAVDGWNAGILTAGEDEAALRAKFREMPAPAKVKGIAQKILAAAELRTWSSSGSLAGPELVFVRPGDDPFWDSKWQNVKALRLGDPKRGSDPKEIFLVEPLSAETWSPHLIRGLLMYVLWTSPFTARKLSPPIRRPKLELHVSHDFSELHYAELVDQLRNLWGPSRVKLPAGREVAPRPMTTLALIYRGSRVLWWVALLLALFLGRGGGDPPASAVLAAAVAAVAIFTSRLIKGRMEDELPRRSVPAHGALQP